MTSKQSPSGRPAIQPFHTVLVRAKLNTVRSGPSDGADGPDAWRRGGINILGRWKKHVWCFDYYLPSSTIIIFHNWLKTHFCPISTIRIMFELYGTANRPPAASCFYRHWPVTCIAAQYRWPVDSADCLLSVRAKLDTAQLFARTHGRTAVRPTRMWSKVLFASVAYNLHHLPKYLQLDERRVKSNKK